MDHLAERFEEAAVILVDDLYLFDISDWLEWGNMGSVSIQLAYAKSFSYSIINMNNMMQECSHELVLRK
jgi:hypothetical protein